MYVPKYFRMDPETDDLLFDGYDLKRDMIVLIEGDDLRRNVDVELDPETMGEADKFNRWCTIFNNPRTRDGSVEFIALYEDGTKRKMVVAATHAWYVKKVSIPNTTSTRHTEYITGIRPITEYLMDNLEPGIQDEV